MTEDPLRLVWKRDGRFAFEAYQFLLEALDFVAKQNIPEGPDSKPMHISGQELLEGMRRYATRQFGPLAAQVWRAWGVESTMDWGTIVFQLVDAEMLNRQDSDSIDDFHAAYDFDEAFVDSYQVALPADISPYAQGEQ